MTGTTDRSIFNRRESGVRGYCRRFKGIFTSATGSIMCDATRRKYIDFLAACGALNYGHNDPDMRAALISHLSRNGMSACLDLHSDVKGAFLESFQELILQPRGMDYRVQFTGPTGTNAVEAAMKLARKVTGRSNIIAFTNGFHGVSLGALAATGNRYNRMDALLPGITRVPYDGYLGPEVDTAEYLDLLLEDPSSGVDPPAAVILETVQGEGGLNAASAAWLRKIAAIARNHGALLIIDDIQAGCGRTGTFFSFEEMGIRPDLVTLAKSISGYGLPMALVLIRPELDQWSPAEHNGTFRGNSHAFVTARVALEKFWSDNSFSRSIRSRSALVTRELRAIRTMMSGSRLKGRGMMQGIDVGCGRRAAEICALCFRHGLICETSGPHDEVIKILAPLNIPRPLLQQGLAVLGRAVRETTGRKHKIMKKKAKKHHDYPTLHHHRNGSAKTPSGHCAHLLRA